ncbi:dTDP-4-dehydrorhamnose reductase [Trueperella pyogenes]|uniref:dTDP-4-dehydrorhamnose reductase n=1 Tax=Trueperella pyogenes TaxID=1661 RepID=UPI000C1B754D|nr:dTDP-4-dehydrorhamnose reductase [Trueperella pyogenes]AWG04133.1 dTDP-4-dehydrorhamnose reductase [Trueperella pyogenes]AWG16861.1 dTDP-4-dehydrorhamnose reductase [Trueperella pyogenes]AZR03852.1 dTDP-4-dehydrorhamnose reductase [Trueperella pyogenes]PIN52297.1 dTDP-4-dehydrorhamnose reductase [Trueperella pyogenes]
MHWTIIGAAGMLGTDLTEMVKERGGDVVAIDRPEIDITDPASVAALEATDVIVNCAAYTAVDLAEEHEADAFVVNAVGPQLLARRAAELGAHVVHISTDYVFAGDAPAPYGEYAPIAPKSAYGRTKAAGEWAVRSETDAYYIVRTAWLYGEHGKCFPKTMAKLSDSHPQLSVVTDEVGQPTWTRDLADLIIRLVEAGAPSGIYHGTASGQTNWHGFTKEIIAAYGKDPAIVGETTAAAFKRPAPRPSYSVLAHDALDAVGIAPIGHWKERWAEAAQRVLANLG